MIATKAKSKPAKVKPTPVRAPAPPGEPREVRGTAKTSELRPCPTNPRQTIPEESVQELAASFAQVGVLQPLVVRPVPLTAEFRNDDWVGLKHYEVVAGHRRLAAAKLARLPKVPVVVRWLSDEDVLLVQLMENDQREDVKPSEQAAAYSRLAAAGKTAERIAEATGKPVAFVRGLLRLARLPAWALAAVDTGRLPRATAEIVARVPGEESRKKAAACAMMGLSHPRDLDNTTFSEWTEETRPDGDAAPLSFREARTLVNAHFTRELKGAPFSRTALDLLDGVGSCDACPNRAGNDPEAKAGGVRADTCLNPDCFRAKAEAARARVLVDAEKKGIVPVPDEFAWPMSFVASDHPKPPKGWCVLDAKCLATELSQEITAGYLGMSFRAYLKEHKQTPQVYLAFHNDKPIHLVKTTEARKGLIAANVFDKPEPRKRESAKNGDSTHKNGHSSYQTGPNTDNSAPSTHKPAAPKKPAEPTKWEIDDRAVLLASRDIRDCAEANFESLAPLAANGGPETDAYEALQFVGRVLIRDWLDVGTERLDVLREYLPGMKEEYGSVNLRESAAKVYAAAIADATPQRMLGFLLHLCTSVVLADPSRFAAADGQSLKDWLLGHYDVSWDACRETAEMELKREMNEPQEAA